MQPYASTADCVSKILRTEGPRSFYRGARSPASSMPPPTSSAPPPAPAGLPAPSAAARACTRRLWGGLGRGSLGQRGVFRGLRAHRPCGRAQARGASLHPPPAVRALPPRLRQRRARGRRHRLGTTAATVAAGIVAQAAAGIVFTPMDLVKERLQVRRLGRRASLRFRPGAPLLRGRHGRGRPVRRSSRCRSSPPGRCPGYLRTARTPAAPTPLPASCCRTARGAFSGAPASVRRVEPCCVRRVSRIFPPS